MGQGTLGVSTITNDAVTNTAWAGTEVTGATAYDTSTISGAVDGFVPTGSVSYTFFTNDTCTGDGTSAGNKAIQDGTVPPSDTVGPLGAGSYSFDAVYTDDANYNSSAVSACEPFMVLKAGPAAATILFDAVTNGAWSGTETTGATAYDTSTVTGVTGFVLTGTVTYSYFTNGTCTGTPTSTQDVTLSSTGTVPNSATTAALAAGNYSFDATYGGDTNYSASPPSACEPFTVAAVATAPATVTPTTAPPVTKPAVIAFTGADIAGMGAAGLALLGLGGFFVVLSRRRRHQQPG